MAVKFTRKPSDYISQSAYMYDVARSSDYFDKSVYESLVDAGNVELKDQYLMGVAGSKGKKPTGAFNQHDYNYLSSEDKAQYFLTTMYEDPNSENYKQSMAYFDAKVQEGIDAETYAGLNAFEKTMASIGGIVGNVLNETILGTVEGLVDAGAVLFGQKDWAATDFTGVGENREALQRFARAYSYLDKNKVWSVANDVAVGIGQMIPMIGLNAIAPGLGSVVYFGAMAGNTAADAVRTNPDIDYLSLISYTALTTSVEFVTEKISAGIFGGTGNFIDNAIFGATGKGLTKVGQKAVGNWLGRVGLNFLSEGLEESISEFANVALFNAFVAQGNDELRKSYSIEEILYAGLVGGLVGGLMEGGRIATTTKLTVPDAAGVKTLTKTQSLALSEQLANANRLLQTDAVADLKTKYKTENLEQIKTEHAEEYQRAVEKNKEISDQMSEIAVGLSRIYQIAGAEKFNKAVDLVNGINENSRKLLSNYVNYASTTTQTQVSRRINHSLQKSYGEDVSFTLETAPTAEQLRLQQNLKNKHGITVYYGKFGVADGVNKKFGLTISENEIVLDTEQFGTMSEQEILDKVVKEELVHTLQFTKGILTPQTLYEIYLAMGTEQYRRGELFDSKQAIDEAYKQETGLTKLAEAQAKSVAEVLLFDKLTVSKMFYTQYSTLNKVYNVLRNLKTKLEDGKELRKQKNKVKYNTLLHVMQDYREIAAQKLGTDENIEQFIKDYQITEQQAKTLRETYLQNPDIGPIEDYEILAFRKRKSEPIEGQISMAEEVGRRVLEGETTQEPETIETETIETEPIPEEIVIEDEPALTYKEEIDNDVEIYTSVTEMKSADAEQISQKILKLVENSTVKESQVKTTKAKDMAYNALEVSMMVDDAFYEVTEENFDEVRSKISSNPTALTLFDESLKMITGANVNNKYSESFVDKVQNLTRVSETSSAQQQALQSALRRNKPVTYMVEQLNDAGYTVNVDVSMLGKFDPSLSDIDTIIKNLDSEISKLKEALKQNAGNSLEQAALTQELVSKMQALAAFRSKDAFAILDWLVRNTETFEGLNMSQKKLDKILNTFLEMLEKVDDSGKELGFYLTDSTGELKSFPKARSWMYKILKGMRSFRMWAMTSSPISWIRNWIGNFGMKALDNATNVMERAFTKGFQSKGKIPTDSVKFNETKGGKEVYKHIEETQGDYIHSLTRGETKYSTEEGKLRYSRELRKKEYQDANGFRKMLLKAKDLNDWGLSTGVFGDDNFIYSAVCKNMGNLVASSSEYLLKGIQSEFDTLTALKKQGALSPEKQTRLELCEKALKSKNNNDIFDAIEPAEMKRLLDACHNRAKEQYFKNSNKFSKWMANLAEKSPIKAELMSWVIPFPKVASNIMVMAARYSPLGFFNALSNFSKAKQAAADPTGKFDPTVYQQKGIRSLAEANVGTVMLIAGALFAALGWVDIEDDDYMGPSLHMGDVRISLSDLAPSMTTFSTAAAMVYGWKNNKNAFELALNTIYDNTLLSNIENVFRYSTPEDYVQNLSISYFASYIPAVVKLVNKWTTGGAYKDKTGSYWSKLTKTLASYVPGLSQTVPNKINPYTGGKMYPTETSSGFFNFLATLSPLQIEKDTASDLQLEAERLDAETSGLSGSFTITTSNKQGKENSSKISLKNSSKEKYAKYRAEYISSRYNDIASGKELVTIYDKDKKQYKTVKYEKLTDEEKSRVLKNLYTTAAEIVKIRYWLDQGNSYYVTDKDKYKEYKKLFGNSSKITYKSSWKSSNFVEG